ncbi:hypothetical protein, partial [Escherichia coli]|uniref:hypothetical protein n=1 Tax=Escherichia coli TaxID=562 RepID=UPI001BDBAD2D
SGAGDKCTGSIIKKEPATDLKKKTLAKRPYMFVETYFSQTAMMPVNILSICGLFQLQMLY